MNEYARPPYFNFEDMNLHIICSDTRKNKVYTDKQEIDRIVHLSRKQLTRYLINRWQELKDEFDPNKTCSVKERNEIINEYQIICTTLSTSGSETCSILKDTIDYLIVDEACQCVELSNLIPF